MPYGSTEMYVGRDATGQRYWQREWCWWAFSGEPVRSRVERPLDAVVPARFAPEPPAAHAAPVPAREARWNND